MDRDDYLQDIWNSTRNAMAGGVSAEAVARVMAEAIAAYLNKTAEIEGRLPSFSARDIQFTSIVIDGSK